jgi:hypothetical protein
VGMDLGEAFLQAEEGRAEESFALFASNPRARVDRTGRASHGHGHGAAAQAPRRIRRVARDRHGFTARPLIQEVVRHLDLVLPLRDRERRTVSGSAIVQARDRVGPQPLAWLFQHSADAWATASAAEHRWRGLAVLGVDGTTLRVPDSPENDAEFGRPGTSRGEAAAGYPQLRLVALMVRRSHLLASMAFGPYSDGEITLAQDLWSKLPDRSLTILDREFAIYELFHQLADPSRERHWLTRAKQGKTTAKLIVVQRLGPNDTIVELRPSRNTRRLHPTLPERLRVRAIHYQRRGFRPQTLLTSLIDPETYPATEIIALYHERWELELGFDEVKTHTLEREEASLRCKAPERVAQELWGLALAYNLVRLAMACVAQRAGVSPARISYRHALNFIRLFWLSAHLASPGVLPRRLETPHEELARCSFCPLDALAASPERSRSR